MLPIHLIALNMEHVYVKFAIDAARSRGYGIKGIRVDCVYWDDRRSSNGSAKDKHHDMHCHMQDVCKESRDSPICQLKVESAKTSFCVKWQTPKIVAEASHWRHASDPMSATSTDAGTFCSWVNAPILKREWTKLREDNALSWMFKDASPLCRSVIDIVSRHERPTVCKPLGGWLDGMQNTQLLAQIAYDNNGALIQALAPGCGKTTIIDTFTQLLRDKGLAQGKDYFVMSVTHVAAALADGSTIAHFRHAGRNKNNIWLIIDECSFNSAHMWNWLSKFKMMGCKCLVLGDFAGQLLPITAQTDNFDYNKIADSDFMHDLCNGLRIDLTEFRRGPDLNHFGFMQSLYDPSLQLATAINNAKAFYPRSDNRQPHYILVISHTNRLRINRATNEILARGRMDTQLLKPSEVRPGSMANLPQDMHVWPGIKLQACVKQREQNIVYGLEYEILSTTDMTVQLRQLHPSGDAAKHGEPFELPHEETANKFRLQHALCYYTAQGRTLRDGLVICADTDHAMFSIRHLIVGIGRVGAAIDMEVM